VGTTLAIVAAGCASTPQTPPATEASGRVYAPVAPPFESWAAGNGTGSFFRPLGPAEGTGVRRAWPQ